MSNFRNNSAILYGYRTIGLGIQLLKKPNKNEFEESAAKAFKLSIVSTLIIVVIFFLIASVSITSTFNSSAVSNYSSRRTGTVEGDKVRYVQNTMKYVSLEELNINEVDVIQGEKIRLFFDTEDRLVGGELESETDAKIYNLLFILGSSVVAIIILSIVIRTTYGKPWYQWLKSLK